MDQSQDNSQGQAYRSDIAELTVEQLKARLKSLKLPVYGCKRTLTQRLITGHSPRTKVCETTSSTFSSASNFPVFDVPSQFSTSQSFQSELTRCKLTELRDKCKAMGLPSSGRKQELVDRLEQRNECSLLKQSGMMGVDDRADFVCNDVDMLDDWNITESQPPNTPADTKHDNVFSDTSMSLHTPLRRPNSKFEPPSVSPGQAYSPIPLSSIKSDTDFERFTYLNLKNICKYYKLKVSGRKSEIVDRIREHLRQNQGTNFVNLSYDIIPEAPSHSLIRDVEFPKIPVSFTDTPSDDLQPLEDEYFLRRNKKPKPNKDSSLMNNSSATTGSYIPVENKPTLKRRSNSKNNYTYGEVAAKPLPIKDLIHEIASTRFFLLDSKFDHTYNVWFCRVGQAEKVFNVKMGQNSTCSCASQEDKKLSTCTHILFLFLRVLNFDFEDEILMQKTLSAGETIEVVKRVKKVEATRNTVARKRIITRTGAQCLEAQSAIGESKEVVRENWTQKICKICCEPFSTSEKLVWCQASCGKSLHKVCLKKLFRHQSNIASKNSEVASHKCPYCHEAWKSSWRTL